MKVVTYNIRYGVGLDQQCDLERIADEVRGADIIALQEVERFWRRTGMVDQPQVLGELLEGYYWSYCPAFDMDASSKTDDGRVLNRRRQFGPMVLSRYPIVSARPLVLPQLAAVNLISMSTGALETVIATPCGPLRVYSLHLSALSPQERLLQIDALLDMHKSIEQCGGVMTGVVDSEPANASEAKHIKQMDWSNGEPALPIPTNTLFMGDFNSTVQSKEYLRFVGETDPIYGYGVHSGSYVDSWHVARETTGEPTSWWPDPPDRLPGHPLRLDYCFASAELAAKIRRSWVDSNATGSDHRPVWVEFDE
jgi:endonuclease/exonuclease/phosphatase family metal-dependent hydrolase